MNEPATSLDLLHGLVLPPDVAWWPPAPGWYVVIAILLLGGILMLARLVSRYRADAYRRAALRELANLEDVAGIAELLRRTAMVVASRATVAQLKGAAWLDWLAQNGPQPLPETLRELLTTGVYGRPDVKHDFDALREYAASWIKGHPVMPEDSPGC
jgi:hypothetical protein